MGDKSTLIDARRKNWFWDYNDIFGSELTPNAKLVRLYLAKCADNNTRQAWPSLSNIAENCGISRTTAKKVINELVEAGWLIKKTRKEDGVYTSNLYYLPDPDEIAKNKSKANGQKRGRADNDLPCNEMAGVGQNPTHGRVNTDPGVGRETTRNNTHIVTIPNEQDYIKDRVTIDSLRSSIVTRGPQIENEQETDIQNSCIEPFQIPENDLTSAGIFEEKDSSERKCDLFKKIIPGDTRTGINDKDSTSEKVSSLSDKVTGSSNTSNTNESIEIQETPQITNRDLITMLGDTLREAWDGPPGKAYAIAGRMYYLYDYPAAEASINNFCRQVKNGFKPKNPIAYLMKVAREKKKEFESEYEVSQPEEELEYFSIQYPEEHKKRVAEAKRVSAEHERYLKDYRDFLINKAPPIPGFITPGGCYKQLQEGGMKCN